MNSQLRLIIQIVHADGFGIYIGDTGYSSYLDKGRLMAYDEVAQDWFEIGIFDTIYWR